MVNYQMGKIYKIVDNTNENIYIGSTSEPTLAKRLANHLRSYKYYLTHKTHYISSFKIIENGDYEIVLLETYPCNLKDELKARERYYIETLNCVNKYIPTRTREEYREEHKEDKKAYDQIYKAENKEKISEYRLEYYQNNKDYFKQKNDEYYEQNKEQLKIEKHQYYIDNRREKILEQRRNYTLEQKKLLSETSLKYYHANKEIIAIKKRKYNEEHKEMHREKQAEKCQCECGAIITNGSRYLHLKSKSHFNKLNMNINNGAFLSI
jgi:hypothetical protein